MAATTGAGPAWEGARNLADLGGLPLQGGGRTAYGVVWRSGAPDDVSAQGWADARAAGLRRIVDLRNAVEREQEVTPDGIEVVHAPTEDPEDEDFLAECGPWLDHPRSWTPNLRRYPDKVAHAVTAVGEADGGVLLHCAGGRDRTGMIGSMLLVLAGVGVEGLLVNYERGFRGAAAHRGHTMAYDAATGAWAPEQPDADRDPGELDRAVEERRPALREWHATFDVRGYLEQAGVDARLLRRLGDRLRGSEPSKQH